MIRTQLARVKKNVYKTMFRWTDVLLETDYYWRYTMKVNGYHSTDYQFGIDQIAFVHLPKTGGTSFCKMLSAGQQSTFVNLQIHRPISRHCPVGDYKYITVLRDPVDRVWSYYQMVLRNPPGYPYRNFAVKGLAHFLKNCWAARDMACQYLSGMVYRQVNEQLYETAWSHLNQFYAVLDFQQFNSEVTSFFRQHQIPFTSLLHERKATYQPPSSAERELIRTFNRYDIKLYERWKQEKLNKCQD